MAHRYLLLEVSTENESFLAVAKWSRERLDDIARRIEMAKVAKKADRDLAYLSFRDDIDVYEHPGDRALEDALGVDVAEVLDMDHWVVTENAPPVGEPLRESTSLEVNTYGNFYWDIYPKYGSDVISTPVLRIDDAALR